MSASDMYKILGDNQEQGIAQNCLMPLRVSVVDEEEKAVEDAEVTFEFSEVPSGATGQRLTIGNSGKTDVNGQVSAVLKLGNVGGRYLIEAGVEGLDSAVFTECGVALSDYSDLKKYLNIPDSETENDEIYASWLGEVSTEIESRLHQPVMPRLGKQEILNGNRMARIYTHCSRIVELTKDSAGSILNSVQQRDDSTSEWYCLVDDERQIYLPEDNRWAVELLDYNYFPNGLKNIRISFVGGMNPVPGDLHEMSQQMVQAMIDSTKKGGNPRLGFQSRSRGAAGSPLGDSFRDLDQDWQKVINRYKRLV